MAVLSEIPLDPPLKKGEAQVAACAITYPIITCIGKGKGRAHDAYRLIRGTGIIPLPVWMDSTPLIGIRAMAMATFS